MEEALSMGVRIDAVFASPTLEGTRRGQTLKARVIDASIRLVDVTDEELAELATTDQPQGVLAVIEPPVWNWGHIAVPPRGALVVLDAVQDPGNVGTIVRTAAALGALATIALPGTAELWNPKTLRASMGALFRLPAFAAAPGDVAAWLSQRQFTVIRTGRDGEPFEPSRLPARIAIVLGNEGAGVRTELAAPDPRTVTIPVAAGVESLNVAVAAGILLYGVARDR